MLSCYEQWRREGEPVASSLGGLNTMGENNATVTSNDQQTELFHVI